MSTHNKIEDELVFSLTNVHRHTVKKRFLQRVERKCSICGQQELWLNKKLVLILDHINGINNDNKISNLRLLCPNCNSQTDTFAGRNTKKSKKHYYCKCGNEITSRAIKCKTCSNLERQIITKIIWPSKEELTKMVWEKPSSLLAKDLGVSDVAIHLMCKKLKIQKPARGYWKNHGPLLVG